MNKFNFTDNAITSPFTPEVTDPDNGVEETGVELNIIYPLTS